MTTKRIIGDNSHGYTNEQELVNALNNKVYGSLNTHLKNLFIKYALTIT